MATTVRSYFSNEIFFPNNYSLKTRKMNENDDKMQLIERLLKKNLTQDKENNENEDTMSSHDIDSLLSQFYAQNKSTIDQQLLNESNKLNMKKFLPQQGFCLKTHNSKNEKVFINICKSNEIQAPKDISEQELLEIIDKQRDENELQNAAFQFRVPMSLGEPHQELDNAGGSCTCYDVCINTLFYDKILRLASFMGFFMSIVIEGLEEKYSTSLDRNCKMLKNKKFQGTPQEHIIRTKSKPVISEINPSESKNLEVEKYEDDKQKITPKYKIIREPKEIELPIEFLIAEIELPKLISSKSLILDLGEDRVLLQSRNGLYYLDIFLPFNINQDECGAEFDRKRKVLTLTMPVLL